MTLFVYYLLRISLVVLYCTTNTIVVRMQNANAAFHFSTLSSIGFCANIANTVMNNFNAKRRQRELVLRFQVFKSNQQINQKSIKKVTCILVFPKTSNSTISTFEPDSIMPSQVPRSIKWRIQLGLLEDSGQKMDSDHQEIYLHDLAKQNMSIVNSHRKRYEELAQRHYSQSRVLSIINDTAVQTSKDPKTIAKIVVDDPLSMMASMEEEKIKVDKKKQLARKKELVMMTRPHMRHHPSSKGSGYETQKGSTGSSENDVQSKTRWDEFYSSKEIVDIIEKDLDRLPIDHHVYFHQRKTKEVISGHDKDWIMDNPASMQSRKERSKLLSKILFVYAKENNIGYRQGMHEVLSFLLMALEIDLLSFDSSNANIGNHNDIRTILDASKIVHDAFSMFDAIMTRLFTAFEYRDDSSDVDTRKERMGDATVRIIRDWHGDDALADFISNLDVPPELYCTRWVRLMFSREVCGLDNVFQLWDHFLNELTDTVSLMLVLETTAASMIILIQDTLLPLQPNMYNDDPYNGIDVVDEPMHLLMNYPQIENISPLIGTFEMLINNQKMGTKPPKIQRNPTMQPFVDSYEYSSQNQAVYPIQDNVYFSQGQSDLSHHSYPPQPMQQQNYHQDQFMSTLKSLQKAPAMMKLSTGLNAVRGAAKDALQSIDKQLKTQQQGADNVYHYERTPISSSKVAPDPIDQDIFLGYRDVSTVPVIIDEQRTHLPYSEASSLDTEEHFVGDRNLQGRQSFGQNVPNIASPMAQQPTGDLSEEVSRRMAESIERITRCLHHVSPSEGTVTDARAAVSDLLALQKEIATKYDVSWK